MLRNVGSPILANQGVDCGFISNELYFHWYDAFWGNQKQNYESLCSNWTISYHCEVSWFLIVKTCIIVELKKDCLEID